MNEIRTFDGWVDRPENLTNEESVLAAYDRWKEWAPCHLSGEFAFAVWDASLQQLLLARDPLGVKPLYYFWNGKDFVFSSDITSLFQYPFVSKKPNDSVISHFLLGEFRDHTSTFFEGIRQLPPGHLLIKREGAPPQIKRYWEIQARSFQRHSDPGDYLEEYRHLFAEAVRRRMRGTSPVGILLSGGLDSIQVATMAESLRQADSSLPPLTSATLLLEGFLQEEWQAIQALHQRYGTEIHPVRFLWQENAQSSFELYLQSGETPHPTGFMTIPMLLEPLRTKGCRVVLTGFGASELAQDQFGYLEDLLCAFEGKKFLQETERLAQVTGESVAGLRRFIGEEVVKEKLPPSVRHLIRRFRQSRLSWLTPKMRSKISAEPLPRRRQWPTLYQERMVRAITEPSVVHALNQMGQMAARFSIEVRHPFLDVKLMEFLLSVPPHVKMPFGYRKMFAQTALKAIVPGPMREKEDPRCFIPEMDDATSRKLETDRLRAYLSHPESPVYQYVQYSQVQKLIRRLSSEPTRDWRLSLSLLWRMALLQSWFNNHKEVSYERDYSSLSAR